MKSKHRYEASFRVSGEDLDIEALTAASGIRPGNTHVKGSRKSEKQVWPDSLWQISSDLPRTADLAAQLEELISRLKPVIEKIRKSAGPKAEMLFWCAHYTNAYEGFCGGPILSARLLMSIGELGADYSLQTYAGTNMSDV